MQEETLLQELISCRVEHYRNYHKTFRPDDDVDWDDEPYPEYSLYDNDQEREEVKNLLNEEVKYDPPIITLYALETCSCTLGCECNRQFYWYYYCYLSDECFCREDCLTALACRHIHCLHAHY